VPVTPDSRAARDPFDALVRIGIDEIRIGAVTSI